MKSAKKYVAILLSMVMLLLYIGCGKDDAKGYTMDNLGKDNTFVLESNGQDYQPYWNFSNSVTAGENGYYFMYGDSIMYMDKETKKVERLCSDPVCTCRTGITNYIDGNILIKDYCNSKLDGSVDIWYQGGMLYSFEGDQLTDELYVIALKADGSNDYTRLFKVDGRVYDDASTIRMVVTEEDIYIYRIRRVKGMQAYIARYGKDGTKKEDIARFDGDLMSTPIVKAYGNKLFYTLEQDITVDPMKRYDQKGYGVFAYDFNTGETVRVLDDDVYDFAVDEKTNTIYYYVTGKGLYKKNLDKDGFMASSKLYSATDETHICHMSYDGKYIYLNNERNIISNRLATTYEQYTLVLDTEGKEINKLVTDGYSARFSDGNYFFMEFDGSSTTGLRGWYVIDVDDMENIKSIDNYENIKR